MQRTSRLLFSATAGTKRTVSTRLRRSLDPALSHTYRSLFSTHVALRQETHAGKAEALKGTTGDAGSNGNGNGQSSADPSTKRKQLPARFRSLRSVAVKAQQPREESDRRPVASDNGQGSNRVTAISVADQYDMDVVIGILRSHGFSIDPDGTGFDSDQVIHTRGSNIGDIFVFPSGTVVAWSLPTDVVSHLATKTLLPAAINAHTQDQTESEHLEFIEDRKRDNSVIKGDVISLGARQLETEDESSSRVDTTLAKIAFSSGLARSTKLAVLENMLQEYIDSMKSIPRVLAKGSRLPFSRRFMLQKTGELLELRAQLNHYSELTDSLPDMLWDQSTSLEGYYEQVGKVLDVGIRIRTLNQKMDYAQEIASILRQTLSEAHGIYLEWIIIILIAVEVVFGLRKEWTEWHERAAREEQALKA